MAESPNYQIKALEKMEFIATTHTLITPTTKYTDIILPVLQRPLEEKNIAKSILGAWDSINYTPGLARPAGEAKPWVWIHVKLAEKLGIDPKKYFR